MSKSAKARSLAFINTPDAPELSIVLDNGEHYFIELTPHQIALMSEEYACFMAEQFRRMTKENETRAMA